MTVWHPDTCECIIEIDDKTGAVARHLSRCAVHRELGHDHADVHRENQTKNIAIGDVEAALPHHAGKLAWKFDKQRKLTLLLPDNASAKDKATAASVVTKAGRRASG